MITESNINTHHISYENIGDERFIDLIVICRPCHQLLHDFIAKMVEKGFSQRRVMEKLQPYCVRRLVVVHEQWNEFKR